MDGWAAPVLDVGAAVDDGAAGVDVADGVCLGGLDGLLLPQPAAPSTRALAARAAAMTDTFVIMDSFGCSPTSRAT